jgi:twitching motility protein PilT
MFLNDYAGPEKRTTKRQISRFTLRYKIPSQSDSTINTAITSDISCAGLSFEDSHVIPIDTELDCEILFPQLPEPLKIKGAVKRITKIEKTNNYFYGITFRGIEEKDRQILEQYIQLISINNILRTAFKNGASDVHLVAGQPPIMRVTGELTKMSGVAIGAHDLKEMILSILMEKQIAQLNREMELDFSYAITEGIRFRGNIHFEKGNLEAAFRAISPEIKTIQELGVSPVVAELAKKKSGLILVTGPAGSGKSTTLAALIDLINKEKNCMIISIEDPIEYVYASNKSIIKQREVGVDTLSFNLALKHILRQDPNVILVGEMRDLDSISMTITAAETGHLVLSTLHTSDSIEAINRIIDVYPKDQQTQIRSQLAACLEGVVAQLLLPDTSGKGRVLASEILIVTPAIKNLIRNGQLTQIYSYIESGGNSGMQTMDDSLLSLVYSGRLSRDLAAGYMKNSLKLKALA